MLKSISAVLIAASMLAAPAMAASPTKDAAKTPVTTTAPAPTVKPVASIDSKVQKAPVLNKAALNANAKMVRHHHRHMRHHHRFHKKMGALRTHRHVVSKSTVTHIKRG